MKFFKKIIFPWTKISARCGHLTKRKDSITAFEETVSCKLPLNNDRSTDYCHACLEKMTIRCAWCGKPIFIGDPVTLYAQSDESDQELPDYAVKYGERSYVGCLRWECADSGADRSGFWNPPGEVFRVMSPLEQCLQSNDIVICGDLSDINQAIPLK